MSNYIDIGIQIQMEHNEAAHEKMYELLVHAASQIRKKLTIDDLSYRVQLSPTIDSKKYYLHSILNEFFTPLEYSGRCVYKRKEKF